MKKLREFIVYQNATANHQNAMKKNLKKKIMNERHQKNIMNNA